jgi:hypothetical protein
MSYPLRFRPISLNSCTLFTSVESFVVSMPQRSSALLLFEQTAFNPTDGCTMCISTILNQEKIVFTRERHNATLCW